MIEPGNLYRKGVLAASIFMLIGGAIGLTFQLHEEQWFFDSQQLLPALMFRSQDVLWLLLASIFTVLSWVVSIWSGIFINFKYFRCSIFNLACLCVLVCSVGVVFVYHEYALSYDEYLTVFEWKLLLAGRLVAPIDGIWRSDCTALAPMFMWADPACNWIASSYRPMNALVHAFFALFGLGAFANAFMSGATIVVVAALARRFWPDLPWAACVAALLLFTSPQFLINGMTSYAMPGHLLLNMVWLWLFVRSSRLSHVAAALIGFIAVGYHQFHWHPLFVMPFMLTLLWERRWGAVIWYAGTYAVSVAFWWQWLAVLQQLTPSAGAPEILSPTVPQSSWLSLLNLPDGANIGQNLMNLARFIAWQNPVLSAFVCVAIIRYRNLDQISRNLLWACVWALLPRIFVSPIQGHGWGFRYLHPELGGLVLVATAAIMMAGKTDLRQRLLRFAALGTAFVVTLGIPLRVWQTEAFVRPFAEGQQLVAKQPAEVVILDLGGSWYAQDLIRNDPFLRDRPIILGLQTSKEELIRAACRRHSVAIISREELANVGIPFSNIVKADPGRIEQLRNMLREEGCLKMG